MYKAIFYSNLTAYNKAKLSSGVIQAHDPFNMIVMDSETPTPGTTRDIQNSLLFTDITAIPSNRVILKISTVEKTFYQDSVVALKTNKINILEELYNMSFIIVEISRLTSFADFENKISTIPNLYIDYLQEDTINQTDLHYSIPYNEHWHLGNIEAQQAWDAMAPFANNVDAPSNVGQAPFWTQVALIDAGVEVSHPDLVGRISQTYSWNLVNNNSNVTPQNEFENHGTAMAGIIAGNSLNNNYILSPSNNYIRLQVLKAGYMIPGNLFFMTTSHFMGALQRAAANPNCVAVVMAFGSTTNIYGQAIADAIAFVRTQGRNCKGTLVFASAGNSLNTPSLMYPAALPNVLAIGGSSTTNTRLPFSSYGTGLFAAAPGKQIVTLDRTGTAGYVTTTSSNPFTQFDAYTTNLATYRYFQGTSASVGIAGAIAGCLAAIKPDITAEQMEEILASTAEETGGYVYTDGISPELGHGVLRMNAAVQAVINLVEAVPDPVDATLTITSSAITTTTCSNITVATEVTGTGAAWDNAAYIQFQYYASSSSEFLPSAVLIGQNYMSVVPSGAYTYLFAVPNIASIIDTTTDLHVLAILYNSCGQIISDGVTEILDNVSMDITASGCAVVDAAVQIDNYAFSYGANGSIQRRFTVKYTNTGNVPITSIVVTRGWVGGTTASQTISGSGLGTTGSLAPGATTPFTTITFNQPVPALPATYFTQINTVNGIVDANPANNFASYSISQ